MSTNFVSLPSALPSQAGNAGDLLTTDGNNASWTPSVSASSVSYTPSGEMTATTVQAAIDEITNIQNGYHLIDDFVTGITGPNLGISTLGWRNGGNGASAGLVGFNAAGTPLGVSGRMGLIQFTTGTGSNNNGQGLIDLQTAQLYAGMVQTFTMTWSLQTPAALAVSGGVDYIIEFGLGNYQYEQTSTGAVIQYNRATSTNWSAYTSQNGTQTLITTSDSPDFQIAAATWYEFQLVMTSSSVKFYVAPGGTTSWVLLGTSTTNLPSSSFQCCPFFTIYKVNGTTTTPTKMLLDWVTFDYVFASER